MNIFIICSSFLIHILFLIYFIRFISKNKKNRITRKKEITLFDNPNSILIPWSIGFILMVLYSFLYFFVFSRNIQTTKYYLIPLFSITLFFPFFAFLCSGYKIEFNENEIIKHFLFQKRIIKYTQITSIKQTDFGYKIFFNNKILFKVDGRYHSNIISCLNFLEKKTGLMVN